MATKEVKEKIYWAGAQTYQIANWRPEIKQNGNVVQMEGPLTIYGHVLQTSDPKKIRFIEKSGVLESGEIVLVETLEEANLKTARLTAQRRQGLVKNDNVTIEKTAEQVQMATVASVAEGAG